MGLSAHRNPLSDVLSLTPMITISISVGRLRILALRFPEAKLKDRGDYNEGQIGFYAE